MENKSEDNRKETGNETEDKIKGRNFKPPHERDVSNLDP